MSLNVGAGVKALIAVGLLFISSYAFAVEGTLSRYIVEIHVDGEGTHYFRGSRVQSGGFTAWGITSCPDAMYVYTRDLLLQKDVLATALTAATSGRAVVFFGTCDADGMYFHATRVLTTF